MSGESCQKRVCWFCVYHLKIFPNKECQNCNSDYNNYEPIKEEKLK